MSEWYRSKRASKGDFRKLLQERFDDADPCRIELINDEKRRFVRL